MNVSCDKCGKRYVISDDKVAGKTSVKIRCKQCQNLIQVTVTQAAGAQAAAAGPAPQQPHTSRPSSAGGVVPRQQPSPWEEESTRAMPPMDTSAQWFAMLAGKQQGPFGVAELQKRVTAGELTLRTYLWKAGMGDWKRASDVPELSPIFAGVAMPAQVTHSKPPPPPRAATATKTPAVQRDVALSNEVPAPGLTNRPSAQSGVGAVVTKQQAPLNDLFGDVSGLNDLPKDLKGARQEPSFGDPEASEMDSAALKSAVGQHEPVADPFAALSENDGKEAPPPGEATRFFIAQAGVNKRNPPWKIALAVLGFVVAPIALIYVLNTFEIVKLPTVTTTNEKGEEVQESFFSSSGVGGLKDLLTGDAKKRKAQAEKEKADAEALAKAKALAANVKRDKPDEPEVVVPKPQDPNLAAFYENDDKRQIGPKKRRDEDAANPGGAVNTSGLSQEAVAKVVADKNKAFQLCIDNALRRTPNLAVGKLDVVLTVSPSGAVKSAALNPKKHEMTDWGQCMMSTGKRIVFPSSDAETQIELPFTVGVAVAP
ncbi:MAG: zinc-ribbon domain-containing protein [Archangium sp.]|nr:zinc-ribbon domain-containing protein [Archangium sp.]